MKTKRKPRQRLIATTTYLYPGQKERLDDLVARTKVPAAVYWRAGLEAVLKRPELVQDPA
jgi:predicted DNA-binding protein